MLPANSSSELYPNRNIHCRAKSLVMICESTVSLGQKMACVPIPNMQMNMVSTTTKLVSSLI